MFAPALKTINRVAPKLAALSSKLSHRQELARYRKNLPCLPLGDRLVVNALRKEGVCISSLEALKISSTAQLLHAAHQVLPSLATMSPTPSTNVWTRESHAVQIGSGQAIAKHPDLFTWGLEDRLLNLVESYIGLPVAYFGVSLCRDIADGQQVGTRLWHRDGEDHRVVKIIIYLNDVDEAGGPFEYIPRRLTPAGRRVVPYENRLDKGMKQIVPQSAWQACTGAAGTVVIVDTANVFHHGKLPQTDRLALFFTYTSRNPKRASLYTHVNSDVYKEGLMRLASKLTPRQRDCIYWGREFLQTPVVDDRVVTNQDCKISSSVEKSLAL
jgi:hypothetical protein